MTSLVLEPGSELFRALDDAARTKRCVFVAGLPGVGKSLVVQQLAILASGAGRAIHVLQWDVARRPFDTPAILARYPAADGVTHAAIRAAVGLWARDAVRRWHAAHPDAREVLIGETPLVGGRLVELARPTDDDVEALLAGERTLFLIPVPTAEVRRAVEGSRARDMAGPRNERERASAPPHLVRWHWAEVADIARRIGEPSEAADGGYDARAYAAVFRSALRHRHSTVLPIPSLLPVSRSAQELPARATELVPSIAEVDHAMSLVDARPPSELERDAERWSDG